TLAANFAGLATRPLAPAIAEAAQALRRQGAAVVIAAAHAGGECKAFGDPHDLSSCVADSEIFRVASGLPAGAVDAIVAGHTHQGIAQVVAGTRVPQSFANGHAFGRIDLTIDRGAGRVVGARIFPPQEICVPERCPAARYEGAPVVPDARVAAAIAPALAAAPGRRAQ